MLIKESKIIEKSIRKCILYSLHIVIKFKIRYCHQKPAERTRVVTIYVLSRKLIVVYR